MGNAGGGSVAPLADVVDDLRRRITLITGEAQSSDAARGRGRDAVSGTVRDTVPGRASGPVAVPEPDSAPHALSRTGQDAVVPAVIPAADALGVPGWLGRHLSRGGLPRGAVTDAVDCPTALVELLATVTGAGGCAAVVGYPHLALAAVEAAGGDLDRTVVIPDPAPHAGAVLGTLVEGLDLVVHRTGSPVTPTAARPVEARLRRSRCALVVCGGWPGARLHLDWHVDGVTGLGRGSGRIRGVTLTGRAHGQGQPPVRFRETVGGCASTAGYGAAHRTAAGTTGNTGTTGAAGTTRRLERAL